MQATAIDKPWWTLRLTYGIVPIVTGIDKFTDRLTDWSIYMNPLVEKIVPLSQPTLMRGIGIIEILAGALVLHPRTTRFGAYLVGAWLFGIAINLVTMGMYYDIALRDVVLGIGAFALAQLSEIRATANKEEPTRIARGIGRPIHAGT